MPETSSPDTDGSPVETHDLLRRWSDREARIIDVVATVLAIVLAVCVIADLDLPGRPALALITFACVPGWAVVRIAGAPASSLTLFAAIGLSIAITILVAELLATVLDWSWRPASIAMLVVSAALLVVRLGRRT